MNRYRRLCWLTALVLLFSLVIGISSSFAEEAVTLRMVESLTSPARTALIRGYLDEFEAANPGIKVTLISPPLSDADNKIAQMLLNKQPVDVLEVRDHTISQFSNNKWLADLGPYVAAWGEYETLQDAAKNDISPMQDDVAYLIPYGFYQRCLYYNVESLQAAGLNPPTTMNELYDHAKQLTDPATNHYGYSFRGAAGGHWYAEMHIQALLGDKVSPDSSFYTVDGETIFSQPEAVDALRYYQALYADCSAPDSLNWSYPEMVEAFCSGTTAFLIQDAEVIATCRERMKEGSWATAVLPVGDETGISFGPMGYAGWGITAHSEHKDEAWKLIAFLSSVKTSTDFSIKNALLPIHTTALDDPYFASEAYACYAEMGANTDKWRSAVAPQAYAGWGEFNNFADSDLQKMLSGSFAIEDLLSKWDQFWLEQQAAHTKQQ